MTFEEASNTVMEFGKHKGKTIDQIAETDDGLRYLDWIVGAGVIRGKRLQKAVETYVSDKTIAKEIEKLS